MNKTLDLIGRHRLTTCMLVFTAVFYIFFIAADRIEQPNEKHSKPAAAKSATLKELQSKEDTLKKNLAERPYLSAGIALFFMALFFTGLGVDVYLLTKFFQKRPWIQEDVLRADPGWGFAEVLQIFIFLFFSETCVALLEMTLSSVMNLKEVGHDILLLLNSLLRDLATVSFVIYLVKGKFKRPLADIGLTTRNFFTNVKRGLVGYVAMILPLILSLFILALIAQLFSYEPMPQEVVQIYLKRSTDRYVLPLTFFVTALGPAIEEVFFRGFAYKVFRKRFGALWAAAATSAIFAGFHMNLMAFFPIFILGLFLAYLYEKTDSLVPSITAHMTHNLLMVCLTLGFKSLAG